MNLFAQPISIPLQDPRDASSAVTVSSVLSGKGITKRKIRKLAAIARAKHTEGHKARRAYSARPFVLYGIPVHRPHNIPGRMSDSDSESSGTPITAFPSARIACSLSGSRPWPLGRRTVLFVFSQQQQFSKPLACRKTGGTTSA